jgi:hypothetical protein
MLCRFVEKNNTKKCKSHITVTWNTKGIPHRYPLFLFMNQYVEDVSNILHVTVTNFFSLYAEVVERFALAGMVEYRH